MVFTSILFLSAILRPHFEDHVRFIVTGDDRWDTHAPRPGLDENGVNVGAMKRLVPAIIGEQPDALLFNGDLVGGGETDEEEASQFKTWLSVMQPIYDAGIKVLAARGNHEMHCPNASKVWLDVFSGSHQSPGSSPKGEEQMTYAFQYKNVLFLSLDQFQTSKLAINQEWLDKTLNAPHPPHVFAFAHKMAFFSGNHTDGMFTAPDARDAFIKSLSKAGARAVFFGHDHLYDHVSASLSGWTEDQSIHQFVVGTAGAPFVKGKQLNAQDGDWKLNRLGHVEKTLGYCVVDVNGPKVTIIFKAETSPGKFESADSFSYQIRN